MAPFDVNESWLALRTEAVIEPALPIVDPHHHLWDGAQPYRLAELRADTGGGHNVVATVFVDCMWDYRRDGPEAMSPVGETERAAEEAARSAESAGARIGGIVSYADLRLGDEVGEVLDARTSPRATACSAASATPPRSTPTGASSGRTPSRRPGSWARRCSTRALANLRQGT